MIHPVPQDTVNKFYTLLELADYTDDSGFAAMEIATPDFVQALYDDNLEQANDILEKHEYALLDYALGFNDNDFLYNLVENGVNVDKEKYERFNSALLDLKTSFDKKKALQGKKHIRQAHDTGWSIIPMTRALNRGDKQRYDDLLEQCNDIVDKLLRLEQREIVE